jgi:hypothetical protein
MSVDFSRTTRRYILEIELFITTVLKTLNPIYIHVMRYLLIVLMSIMALHFSYSKFQICAANFMMKSPV